MSDGFDAVSTIKPGREGFYPESEQYRALRKHLIGNGTTESGVLGLVLRRLQEQHSVQSSVNRIVLEAKQRRKAFLSVAHSITALSLGSTYGRHLRRLFARDDVAPNRLHLAPSYEIALPASIGDYTLQSSSGIADDFLIEPTRRLVRIKSATDTWDDSLYVLGRDFRLILKGGRPSDPLCEIDLTEDCIYLNWLHSTRGRMGDATFIRSALFWWIAYWAADGDVDLMMNLAHHFLSFAVD